METSSVLLVISAIGTTIILVMQTRSNLKVAELKEMASQAKTTADQTHALATTTEINTNSRYTEQRAEIAALKLELKTVRDELTAVRDKQQTELETLKRREASGSGQ